MTGEVPEAIEQDVGQAPIVNNCADAIQLAGQLKQVAIHPDAPGDIDRMDESADAELWGQRLWRHLQALDAYAIEKGPGFINWCESSGNPRVDSSRPSSSR